MGLTPSYTGSPLMTWSSLLAVLMGTRGYGNIQRDEMFLRSFTQEGQGMSSSIQQGRAIFLRDYFSLLSPSIISVIDSHQHHYSAPHDIALMSQVALGKTSWDSHSHPKWPLRVLTR